MSFGFASPIQSRLGPMQPRMNPIAFGQPQNTAPNLSQTTPLNFDQIRGGLQKLGIGGPPASAGPSPGMAPGMAPTGGYTPPAPVDQMNWGNMMGSAMGGAQAAPAAAPAAATDAAGASGSGITEFLTALLGL